MDQENRYKEFYIRLVNLVRSSLSSEIDKTAIEGIISEAIDIFSEDLYCELLIYSYASTKGDYLSAHIANNVILAVAFSTYLKLSRTDVFDVGACAFCHDFGMTKFIKLFQKGHNLNESENALLKKHPLESAEIFKGMFSERVLHGILDIHEQINGQGYPNAKKGNEISSFSKIVSICDVYEALTHPRAFRKEFSPYESMKMIISKKNIIFAEDVVKKFLEFMSIYPIGSLVFLNTGETAMVTGSNGGYPTRSIVKVLLNPKRDIESSAKIIDLLKDNMIYISSPVELAAANEILQVLKPRGEFDL